MFALQTPPEFADGGYWYVFEAATQDGRTAPDEAGTGWTAYYATIGGVVYIVLRKPDAETAPHSSVPPQRVLEQARIEGSVATGRRPFGRINGR